MAQHCFIKSLYPSGQVDGIGSCKELLPTPQMIAELSTFLYGTSQFNNSHKQTPKDQISTFSLQGSFLITSGAIHATVPAKLMQVDCSPPHFLLVPKSLIFIISFLPIRMLKKIECKYINYHKVVMNSANGLQSQFKKLILIHYSFFKI